MSGLVNLLTIRVVIILIPISEDFGIQFGGGAPFLGGGLGWRWLVGAELGFKLGLLITFRSFANNQNFHSSKFPRFVFKEKLNFRPFGEL